MVEARRACAHHQRRAPQALALCVGLALLAGCGGDQPSAANTNNTNTAAATPPTVAVETGGMALGGAAPGGVAAAGAAVTESATAAGEAAASDAGAGSAGGADPSAEAAAPGAAPGADGASADTAAQEAAAMQALPVLQAGAPITVTSATAVYAEPAAAALRYAVYPGDTAFTVVEPGGDFAAYPVEAEGVRWYRVRAPDGLVGWLVASLPAE
jgi:hypothetical protein